jgi:inosose dehydratase
MKSSRRRFIHNLAGLVSLSILSQNGFAQDLFNSRFPISCNAYNWTTFYKRENRIWGADMNTCLAEFSKTGIKAYEPSIENAGQALALIPLLKKYEISMPSVYVNSVVHRQEEVENSIKNVLAIADEVARYGTKIMVTNPSPIRWGGEELKSDDQLIIQAAAMERLGTALREKGITLAYHTHAPEFLAGAREFHHVMLNTRPENVSFCFDVHWVFRGSVDSQVAVFDVLKLYGKRVVELHVRQSLNGIWTETFGEGDIDYTRLVKELKAMNVFPHIVIEQCVEAKTPHTMTGLEAHIKDRLAVEKTFAPLLK